MKTLEQVSFDEMYDGDFYTIIGAGGDLAEWQDGYEKWLEEEGIGKPDYWLSFKGRDINNRYNLLGDNAFQNDITFLAFPLDNLNVGKLAMFKLKCQDRWFRDIVDNSVRRSRELEDDYSESL